MPTRRQLIQKITLNANASSVTFSNIPQNYTDLRMVMTLRTTRTDNIISSLFMSINGVTTNRSYRNILGSGASTSSGTGTDSWVGYASTNGVTASTFSINEIYLPNYTSSANKSFYCKTVNETNASTAYISNSANLWSSSSAINSLTFTAQDNVPFIANSTFYLYGITHVPIIRGGEESVRDGFKYHTFRSTSSLQVIEPGEIEYLVVAGGGGGGSSMANGYGPGGAGAGGYLANTMRLNKGIYPITVGAGGISRRTNTPGDLGNDGTNGSNSSLSDLVVSLGGGFGKGNTGVATAGSGGSGGGSSGINSGPGLGSQGGNGGYGSQTANAYGGGGGGGASGNGGNGSGNVGGDGGAGKQWLNGEYYAGGGGGGRLTNGNAGNGGIGGGTSGAKIAGTDALNAVANTGGGGGAGSPSGSAASRAGNGGSGIVIIRYPYYGN